MSNKIQVVYIAGYGRSGSTLIDGLISQRLGAVSGGELANVFDWADQGKSCACGAVLLECPVWGAPISAAAQASGRSLKEMGQITRQAEFGNGRQRHEWIQIWGAFFDALVSAGVYRLVDSSKSAGGRDRVALLTELENVNLALVIHLIRDLRAVMFSRRRGSNKALETGAGGERKPVASLIAIAGWVRANGLAARQLRRYPGMRLRYEDLGDERGAVLTKVVDRVGSSPLDRDETWLGHHAVAGNRMVRSGWSGQIRMDEEWSRELPFHWRTVGAAVQAACRAFRIV